MTNLLKTDASKEYASKIWLKMVDKAFEANNTETTVYIMNKLAEVITLSLMLDVVTSRRVYFLCNVDHQKMKITRPKTPPNTDIPYKAIHSRENTGFVFGGVSSCVIRKRY